MEQFLWKVAQLAVFIGLSVLLFETVGRPSGTSLPISMIVAFALTAVIFAPFLHLKDWLSRRRLRKNGAMHESVDHHLPR